MVVQIFYAIAAIYYIEVATSTAWTKSLREVARIEVRVLIAVDVPHT